jgi:hypothetical protein
VVAQTPDVASSVDESVSEMPAVSTTATPAADEPDTGDDGSESSETNRGAFDHF